MVDDDTGRVLDAHNEHQALPVASLTKVLTALAAVHHIPAASPVPVSARAQGMPARNMNMKEGQVWSDVDTFHALLMSSANDAAVALAEKSAGSLEAFQVQLAEVAQQLHLADSPVLLDPAGLDDEFSVGGGNFISARDMAVASRALLRDAYLAPIVATKTYAFKGGDGIDHKIGNHNRMLWTYDGAIGVKIGYTKRSQECRIVAARRNGRTMLSVVIGALPGQDTPFTVKLLDEGFGRAAATESSGDRLPGIPTSYGGPGSVKPKTQVARGGATVTSDPSPLSSLAHSRALAAALLVTALLGLLRLRAIRRARRRRRRRAGLRSPS